MEILVGEKRNNLYPWKTADGKFAGYIVEGFKMMPSDGKGEVEVPAGALLAVPKYNQNDRPSINKYSPVIATGWTIEELKPKLDEWLKENKDKSLWSLRAH